MSDCNTWSTQRLAQALHKHAQAARIRTLIPLLFVLLGCSCVSPYKDSGGSDIGDGGLLSDQPCSAPCFFNITPGQTSEVEATRIVTDVLRIDGCVAYNNEGISGYRGFNCGGQVGIAFQPGSDIVMSISFSPSKPLTVGDIVEKYGWPSAVSISQAEISGPRTTIMLLLVDKIRASLSLPIQDGVTYTVEASTRVLSVDYSDKNYYATYSKDTMLWSGYGIYPNTR